MELKLTKKETETLIQLEVSNQEELLTYYPFRYDINIPKPFNEWEIGDKIIFEGILLERIRTIRYSKGMLSRFQIETGEHIFEITIFNRKWISQVKPGTTMLIIGKYEGAQKVTALQYYTSSFDEIYGIQPVYHLKEGITQRQFHRIVMKTLNYYRGSIKDGLPSFLRDRYQLISREAALWHIHNPKNDACLKQAIRRLKYEEFLRFQLAVQLRRKIFVQPEVTASKHFHEEDISSFLNQLPFTLTNGQMSAVHEILEDLKAPITMNRLLQGDVGSGKTIVAIIAMYATYLAGYQAALMAPTEVLAKQQYQYLKQLFEDYSIDIGVLYSAMNSEEKQYTQERLHTGEIQMVVGTHALIQEMVSFHNLGLVITDEQHRFGVKQRLALKEKGKAVDFLMMSATPIPRTLANAYYGDMQISNIIDKPKGRLPIITEVIQGNSIMSLFPFIIDHLHNNERCYVICASIEESERLQLRSVLNIHEAIQEKLESDYPKFSVGLLHGRMKSEERDQIMEDFRKGIIQILVSTTVVEVGIDVPEATIMTIYDAERFGLSQLHQLRGRIGRNDRQSYCYLLTNSKEKEVQERLNVLTESNDGFYIAEMDLKLRGPGDILGTRQSGLPGFILGDLLQDNNILETAKKDALELLENEEFVENSSIFSDINDRIEKNII